MLLWQSCTPFIPIDLPTSSQMPPCDEQVPIVFAHGNLASGDTYSLIFQRFEQNGYCSDRLFAFDWNTIGFENNKLKLTQFIFEVLRETGADKVHLVGHSAGSYLGYDFLKQPLRADLVDKYVHVAGEGYNQPAGPGGSVPTLNLWSTYDFVVPGSDMGGAINVMFDDKDHFEVITSEESFESIYFFLTGQPPAETAIQPTAVKIIQGKAVSFGENIPAEGGTVEIYEVDPLDGTRISSEPTAVFDVREFGFWGPFDAAADTYYEFLIYTGEAGDRPIHYFTQPFETSNQLFYLRSYPPSGSLASGLLDVIPADDDQSISAAFSANRSIITGRDALTADGVNLSTPDFASPEQFSIAIFLFDDNENDESDLYSVPVFDQISNLTGVDFFKSAAELGYTEYIFNGDTLRIPNRPSESDGVSVGIFW